MSCFSFERTLQFPRADIWPLIGDFARSPGPEIKVTVEKEGDKAAAGAGTIRTITVGNVRVREVLEAANPPASFTYRIIGGAPMKEYKANVTLRDSDGNTVIRWDADLKPKFPLTGGICCRVAKSTANKLINAIEKTLTADRK
jgi:carbon monoxide dehydrogenase subunit G